jgi:hypothetical protein
MTVNKLSAFVCFLENLIFRQIFVLFWSFARICSFSIFVETYIADMSKWKIEIGAIIYYNEGALSFWIAALAWFICFNSSFKVFT